jgi:HSP20 family protein
MLRNRVAHLYQELDQWNQWQREIQDTFRDLANRAVAPVQLNLNVWQREDRVLVSLAAPGVKADEVHLSAKGKFLEINIKKAEAIPEEDYIVHKNELVNMGVNQQLQFPFELDPAQTKARLTDGMLIIEVKRHPADEPKKIEVLTN